jgi:uncharacterized protein (TIRG00374 family)
MKSIVNNIIQTVFSILLAGLFLYLAFRGKDISEIWNSLIDVHWIWFVVLFAGSALSHVIRAWRWKYLLAPIKQNISLRNTFSATMIGYLINSIIPRLGEFVRPYVMGKLERISKSATLGTIVLERILDIVTFALIVLTVLAIYAEPFAVWFPAMAEYEWLFFAGSAVMLAFFILMFLRAELLFTFVTKLTFILPKKLHSQADHIFTSFLSGFQASKHPGNYFMIAFTSLLIWLSYVVLLYVPFYIYGFQEEYGLNFGSAAVVQVASGIAFALPTPSGIGSYHAFISFTLSQLFSVNSEQALSYAFYTHIVGFLTTTILGLYYFLRDNIHMADVLNTTTKEEQE